MTIQASARRVADYEVAVLEFERASKVLTDYAREGHWPSGAAVIAEDRARRELVRARKCLQPGDVIPVARWEAGLIVYQFDFFDDWTPVL
jgi:hypothetical protein